MTVTRISQDKWIGLSTDTKPTSDPITGAPLPIPTWFFPTDVAGAYLLSYTGWFEIGAALAALVTTGNVSVGGNLAVTGEFGANGAGAQGVYASGGALPTITPTNSSPYGFSSSTLMNDLVTLVSNIRAALVANGIMS